MNSAIDSDELGSLQPVIQPDEAGRITPNVIKENSAPYIGKVIVYIFGIAVVSLLSFGFMLLLKFHGNTNQDYAIFVRDALNPYIKECATTLGTVFGSILGFVLGYYFKEASSLSDARAKRGD